MTTRVRSASVAAAFAASFVLGAAAWAQVTTTSATTLKSGDLIKLASDGNSETSADSAVYYYGADGKRYVFPTEATYKTWYSDYSKVKVVTGAELGAISIGGNVTYRPGAARLIKITTDPKVYAIGANGTLRAIGSEAVAKEIWGDNWAKSVDDLPDAFFVNYTSGADITAAADFTAATLQAAAPEFSVDRKLQTLEAWTTANAAASASTTTGASTGTSTTTGTAGNVSTDTTTTTTTTTQ